MIEPRTSPTAILVVDDAVVQERADRQQHAEFADEDATPGSAGNSAMSASTKNGGWVGDVQQKERACSSGSVALNIRSMRSVIRIRRRIAGGGDHTESAEHCGQSAPAFAGRR
jgi:hypothetical protein